MNTSILHDDDLTISIGDSGILFETACGAENLRVLQAGETTTIGFGDRGVRDAACIHTYYDRIRELIEQNACRVLILDMRGVWFLPSRTLGALLSLRKSVERVELHNVSDELREGLRVAQLDQVLHVCETSPAAAPAI
jgi:anti-anti-sigma factor